MTNYAERSAEETAAWPPWPAPRQRRLCAQCEHELRRAPDWKLLHETGVRAHRWLCDRCAGVSRSLPRTNPWWPSKMAPDRKEVIIAALNDLLEHGRYRHWVLWGRASENFFDELESLVGDMIVRQNPDPPYDYDDYEFLPFVLDAKRHRARMEDELGKWLASLAP